MRYITGTDRHQIILIPTCIEDYISEDNPVRVIDAFVDSLDLKDMGFIQLDRSNLGRPAYSPGDLLKLFLYGYTNSIRSSRKLEKEAQRNIEVIWLMRELAPDFKTIADFRKNNKAAIKTVFKHFVHLCKEWGLFSHDLIALDGTKFRAWNGRKLNFNMDKLEKKYEYIDAKINDYLERLKLTGKRAIRNVKKQISQRRSRS
jgi:transposase